jgi:hypothetical protein
MRAPGKKKSPTTLTTASTSLRVHTRSSQLSSRIVHPPPRRSASFYSHTNPESIEPNHLELINSTLSHAYAHSASLVPMATSQTAPRDKDTEASRSGQMLEVWFAKFDYPLRKLVFRLWPAGSAGRAPVAYQAFFFLFSGLSSGRWGWGCVGEWDTWDVVVGARLVRREGNVGTFCC